MGDRSEWVKVLEEEAAVQKEVLEADHLLRQQPTVQEAEDERVVELLRAKAAREDYEASTWSYDSD